MNYEIFERLCHEKGVKPAQVSKSTGIATSTLSSWKSGAYTPKQDKLQKIADYFGVSIEYLTTGSTSAAAPVHIISDFEYQIIVEYRKLPRDGKIMFLRTINLELPEEKKERGTGIA